MAQDSNINRLFETNNYSIISKYSAVKSGYFSDRILEEFIESSFPIKSWKRTALVNRGYAARILAVDWIITRAIKFDQVDCIIVLGAGYDTLPFRYSEISWIEIDLPQVVENKIRYIEQKLFYQPCAKLCQDLYCFNDYNYNIFSCDINDLKKLTQGLDTLMQCLNRKRNIAILNEVCLCYIEQDAIKCILDSIIGVLKFSNRIHYIGYEQVKFCETSEFNSVMQNHFRSLGHPIRYFPTPSEITNLFCGKLKFNHVTVAPMYQIFHNVFQGKKIEIEAFSAEPFDEFEEMDLYLAHYALVTGVLIVRDPFLAEYKPPDLDTNADLNEKLENVKISDLCSFRLVESSIHRYGHSSCKLEESGSDCSVLVSGGFGKSQSIEINQISGQHKRLADCLLVIKNSNNFEVQSLDLRELPSNIRLDRMHGQICALVDRNLVFFNGGRQSPVVQNKTNISFLAEITCDRRLLVHHQFPLVDIHSSLSWRHRIKQIGQEKLAQIGGFGSKESLILWNLSSSKLGFYSLNINNMLAFERHSFGLDRQDNNTLVLYGGLQTNNKFVDKPVDSEMGAVLWDSRVDCPVLLAFDGDSTKYYSSDIHFISDHQFVKVGGISASSGLVKDSIMLFDLRNFKNCILIDNFDRGPEQNPFILTGTSCHLTNSKEIVTYGGGGSYFTFGTSFNRSHLIYNYSDVNL